VRATGPPSRVSGSSWHARASSGRVPQRARSWRSHVTRRATGRCRTPQPSPIRRGRQGARPWGDRGRTPCGPGRRRRRNAPHQREFPPRLPPDRGRGRAMDRGLLACHLELQQEIGPLRAGERIVQQASQDRRRERTGYCRTRARTHAAGASRGSRLRPSSPADDARTLAGAARPTRDRPRRR